MAFITVAGENQIAAKQGAAQILNITHFVLANIGGLGAEPVNRIEAMPAAGNIMATLPVTKSGYVNGNQVVYSLVMDSSLGDYDFNWVGLKDADGVLIACTYTPLIQKRKTTGAVPGNNLTRNFLLAFSGIQATTAIAVPAATWQIDFNARLWGIDERERLSNYDIYGHEAFIGNGWKVSRVGATTTYDIAPGVGYVGGIRIADALTQQVTVAGPPKSIWVDVSLQGDISDVSAMVDFIIDAVAHADYTDANGFRHYVTKLANIAADGSVTDMRVLPESVADHEAKLDPHPQYTTEAEVLALISGGASDYIVRYTTTGNIALNGLGTQAGGDWPAALSPDDLVLVRNQTTAPDDGWYNAKSGAWTRATFADVSAEIKSGCLTQVREGATLADTIWMLTTDGAITLGTTALVFARKDAQVHGQCELILSGDNLVLMPRNGNKITINGVAQTIPSGGVPLAAPATTLTNYFIYAFMNAGVPDLEYDATGHSTDASTGVEIKTGDATRTLVGWARTVASAWVDTANQRFVRSWFNTVPLKGNRLFQAERYTASPTPAETSPADRVEVLLWAGETVMTAGSSQVVILSSATSITAGLSIYVDGATSLTTNSINPDTINQSVACVVPNVEAVGLSEDYHYFSPYIAWSGASMAYHSPNNSGIAIWS